MSEPRELTPEEAAGYASHGTGEGWVDAKLCIGNQEIECRMTDPLADKGFELSHPHYAVLRDFFARVTYKPCTQFCVTPIVLSDTVRVELRALCPDVVKPAPHRPGVEVVVAHDFHPLDMPGAEQDLLYIARKLIEAFEAHERDEWFRLDGEPVNDPHPPLMEAPDGA